MATDPVELARSDLEVDAGARAALDRIQTIDFRKNFALATASGRSMASMLADVIRLRRGPGRLTSDEYYYYRLWDPALSASARRRFVGKLAQAAMHHACNREEWRAAASDKLLFAALMAGARLPSPDLLAIVHPHRAMPGIPSLRRVDAVADYLAEPAHYPFFAKPIEGRYSLGVLSADGVDGDRISLNFGHASVAVADVASAFAGRSDGMLIQRRVEPAPSVVARFGARLWAIRALVLRTADGPLIHRATAKIPTGQNPADNFWRAGNLLAALDPADGRLQRVVTGTADSFREVDDHPDTHASFDGFTIPHWAELVALVTVAAELLPGIGTQSWDIAVAAGGPALLEVNYGGDLNLNQLASGYGILDTTFRAHLATHGYRLPAE